MVGEGQVRPGHGCRQQGPFIRRPQLRRGAWKRRSAWQLAPSVPPWECFLGPTGHEDMQKTWPVTQKGMG